MSAKETHQAGYTSSIIRPVQGTGEQDRDHGHPGKPLPPTPKKGQGYIQVDKTKHKTK